MFALCHFLKSVSFIHHMVSFFLLNYLFDIFIKPQEWLMSAIGVYSTCLVLPNFTLFPVFTPDPSFWIHKTKKGKHQQQQKPAIPWRKWRLLACDWRYLQSWRSSSLKLQHTLYKAEDLLDDQEYNFLKRKAKGGRTNGFLLLLLLYVVCSVEEENGETKQNTYVRTPVDSLTDARPSAQTHTYLLRLLCFTWWLLISKCNFVASTPWIKSN